MVSALLSGDPESADLPMRRLGLAIFGSVMVAAIVFAGVGIYGVYNPGGGKLSDQTLVIERETGARFVVINGQLRPVLNVASARLVIGADAAQTTASQKTLRGYPRGPAIGITDAPDSLPAANALAGPVWSVCGASKIDGTTTTVVLVGHGTPGTALTAASGDSLLVAAGSDEYLIWSNHRLRVGDKTALAALQIVTTPVPVSTAVLNAIDAGPDLAAPVVPGAGTTSSHSPGSQPGARVGDVFKADTLWYVLLADGLASVSEPTGRLLRADKTDLPPQISPAEARDAKPSSILEPAGSLTVMPRIANKVPGQTATCATFDGTKANAVVTVGFFEPVPQDLFTVPAAETGGGTQNGVKAADRIVVDNGGGAVVQALPTSGAPATGTTTYLITDAGIKYAFVAGASVDAKTALGYGDVKPVLIPAALLALVPTGPALDPAAALRSPVRATGG